MVCQGKVTIMLHLLRVSSSSIESEDSKVTMKSFSD